MTRCFQDAGLLARDLLSFHQDLSLAPLVRSSYWRAQGVLALLGRATALERALLRSPPHEAELCLSHLTSALRLAGGPAGWVTSFLRRAVEEQRPAGAWLDRLHRWVALLFDARRELRARAVGPGGEGMPRDPFLVDLSGEEACRAFARDLPLLCALIEQHQRPAAEALVRELEGPSREEALARIALSRLRQGASPEELARFPGIRTRDGRRRARLGLLVALQEQDPQAAVDALALLDGPRERALGAAILAERSAAAASGVLESTPRGLLALAQRALDRQDLLIARDLLEAASRELPALVRGEEDRALWHRRFPGLATRSPRLTLELLRLELILRREPDQGLAAGLTRQAPLLHRRLAVDLDTSRWLAARLRAVEAARGAPLIDPQERSAAADRGRALLLLVPAAPGSAPASLPELRALVEGVRGDRWEEARRTGYLGDARSALRSAFDEGVALGPARKAHRRALTQVCRRVLLEAQRGEEVSPRAAASRVRCLLQLPGMPAAQILDEALAVTSPEARGTEAIFGALARIAPDRARAAFFRSFAALHGTAGDRLLEAARPLLSGSLLQGLTELLSFLGRERGLPEAVIDEWVGRLLESWWRERGEAPAGEIFQALRIELHRDAGPLPEADRLLERLQEDTRRLASEPLEALIRGLASEEEAAATLARLTMAGLPEPEPRAPLSFWRALARRIQQEVGSVPAETLRRWCARIAPSLDAGEVASALLRGEPPAPMPREIPLGRGLELAWLSKGRDLLAFLRFADCVPCCFQSTSSAYRSHSMDTQLSVLSLWKDPCSFSFRVQRRTAGGDLRPQGFVFGSFGLCEEGSAVLLNGVYLRRQQPWLRCAIVEAIEEHLAAPLGVPLVGISVRYGSRGGLPPGYAPAPERRVRRLRALVDRSGALARRTYDDLGLQPNQVAASPPYLFWRSPVVEERGSHAGEAQELLAQLGADGGEPHAEPRDRLRATEALGIPEEGHRARGLDGLAPGEAELEAHAGAVGREPPVGGDEHAAAIDDAAAFEAAVEVAGCLWT
jgi:hypothetical protein